MNNFIRQALLVLAVIVFSSTLLASTHPSPDAEDIYRKSFSGKASRLAANAPLMRPQEFVSDARAWTVNDDARSVPPFNPGRVKPNNHVSTGSVGLDQLRREVRQIADVLFQSNKDKRPGSLFKPSAADMAGAHGILVENHPDGRLKTLHLHHAREKMAGNEVDHAKRAEDALLHLGEKLGIEDPVNELVQVGASVDRNGNRHFRYRQQFEGVPLEHRFATVHVDAAGRLYHLNSLTELTPHRKHSDFKLTGLDASDTARAFFGPRTRTVISTQPLWRSMPGRLVRPEWQVRIMTGDLRAYMVNIDGSTGEISSVRLDIRHAGTVVPGSGTDLNGELRSFNTWSDSGIYYLIDPTTPVTTTGDQVDPLTNGPSLYGDLFLIDSNDTEGTTLTLEGSVSATSGWDPVSVSAYANVKTVHEYFVTVHGRDGIDDDMMNLLPVVHFGVDYENAFWNGTYMVFGDGAVFFSPLAGCLDVTAHEMGHGVIEHTANLVYEFQSGALNESFADIFGAMVDRDDWQLGEDCTLASPGFLRSMSNPADGLSAQPGHMDDYQHLTINEDHGGVHVNSGIPNRAAYLLAEGLSEEGLGTSLGRSDTEVLYYHALSNYLSSTSNFSDLRAAMLLSAEDIYPGNGTVLAAVEAAFDAVGITGDGASSGDGGVDTVLGSEDFMAYNYFNGTDLDLYLQILPVSGGAYDPADDFFLPTSVQPHFSRPAIVADGVLFEVGYVGTDFNVYSFDMNVGSDYPLSSSGLYWSVAASEDGNLVAFTVPDASDDNIYVYNFTLDELVAYPINSHDYTDDETGASTFEYTDALSFSPSGRDLVFDALHCVDAPDSLCSSGGGIRSWTVGLLNLASGTVNYPFYESTGAVDIGYPAFAQTNEDVIAFDIVDGQDYEASGYLLLTAIYNIRTTEFLEIVERTTSDPFNPPNRWGSPAFRGDDSALIVGVGQPSGDTLAFNLPLSEAYAGDVAAATTVNDFDVNLAVVAREGVRDLVDALQFSPSSLSFGEVLVGESATQSVTITNNGEVDVSIFSWTLSNPDYTFSLNSNLLTPGASTTMAIRYTPSAVASDSTTLVMESDADPATYNYSIQGIGVEQTFPGEIRFTESSYTVGESSGQVEIAVERVNGSDDPISVDWSLQSGTASAGTDYSAASGSLTWSDGDASNRIITVQVLDDSSDENNETLQVMLSNPTGGATLGSPSSATITITDNDTASSGGGNGGGGGGAPSPWVALALLYRLAFRFRTSAVLSP